MEHLDNVTLSHSNAYEIKLSTWEATLIDSQFHMLLCKWNTQQEEIKDDKQDTPPPKRVVL